jgi:RNA polymerase sigma-70 factor (ECF subfamily)
VSDLESPENAMQRSELQGMIQDCIQGLGEHHRMIVVLADIEQYSYEDIAEIENVSLGTVKSRLSRARASLRDCLQANAELLPEKYRL